MWRISHCGFDLHYLRLSDVAIFSCASWPSAFLLGKCLFSFMPILKSNIGLLCLEVELILYFEIPVFLRADFSTKMDPSDQRQFRISSTHILGNLKFST